jgi:hypothetical protein
MLLNSLYFLDVCGLNKEECKLTIKEVMANSLKITSVIDNQIADRIL